MWMDFSEHLIKVLMEHKCNIVTYILALLYCLVNFLFSLISWLAATKLNPMNARHAFPCYDEPAIKAKFTIQITHGKRFNAISNMQETRVEK